MSNTRPAPELIWKATLINLGIGRSDNRLKIIMIGLFHITPPEIPEHLGSSFGAHLELSGGGRSVVVWKMKVGGGVVMWGKF